MAMIAFKCPDVTVVVVDINQARIDAWNSDALPIYEPGLEEVVQACRGRNLFFSTDTHKHVGEADIVFVSVNTPTKTRGVGAGRAADLTYWEGAARMIAAVSKTSKIVVEKSTVPVRTAEAIEKVLTRNNSHPGVRFDILSNPEFLAEGTAMEDLAKPDRVLIGGRDDEHGRAAVERLASVYERWIPTERVLRANLWSAELSKLTANAMLAQRVSSMNAISALCEATGADVEQVSKCVGTDSRIGPKFLSSSVGFGGSCFQKDILNLVYICESGKVSVFFHFGSGLFLPLARVHARAREIEKQKKQLTLYPRSLSVSVSLSLSLFSSSFTHSSVGLTQVAEYWHSVVAINDYQKQRFVSRVIEAMFNTIAGKRIAVLGFAFKKDTGDTRETPAIDVCKGLLADRALLAVFDPKVTEAQIHEDLHLEKFAWDHPRGGAGASGPDASPSTPRARDVEVVGSALEACRGAHALCVMTEWDEFKGLDFEKIYASMVKPAFVFDGRNVLDHARLREIGFIVYGIGKPLDPFIKKD